MLRLVDRFNAARQAFDPAALDDTLAPDFEEISPVGDVDTRAAVLGFYAPDKRGAAPVMTPSERSVRVAGDAAIVTARIAFTPPSGIAPSRSIRARYVARHGARDWKLVSVQYTPMRSPR